MEERAREKLQVAGAAGFLSILAMVGIAFLLSFTQGERLERIACILLIGSAMAGVFDVSLMLGSPGQSPRLLLLGRVLLWLSFTLLAAASVLGCISLVS